MLAALTLAAMGFVWGMRSGLAWSVRDPYYRNCDPAQLTWVEEGILERISKLQDELARVRGMQNGSAAKTETVPGRNGRGLHCERGET